MQPDQIAPGPLVGYPMWFWNNAVTSIIQAGNNEDTSFYFSPTAVSAYDVTVRLRAYGDDDIIGFVVACVPDEDNGNRPYALNFCRTPNCQNSESGQTLVHAYLEANNPWANRRCFSGAAAKYNVSDLSSPFFYGRAQYTWRFVAPGKDYSVRPVWKDGDWDW